MAAGLGFKDFVTGEVLTAADVDGYLMQGVWVFASAAARDAAVTSPQEGNFAYLKDTNVTTYYTGSAWANLDTTGMTNPMTTTGDTIYSSSGSTPARLGIGSTGQVLTVAGGVPSWATPAGGGGKVLQVVSATTTTRVNISGTTFSDSGLTCDITPSSATSKILILVSQSFYVYSTAATKLAAVRLMRNSTAIFNDDASGSTTGISATGISGGEIAQNIPITHLDSPATTSTITYKTQGNLWSSGSGADLAFQKPTGSSQSSIVLLEIGA